jgi:hypothetical protein
MKLTLDDLRNAFGFGVAGNFAGHLEQAGEAGDFTSVDAPPEAPKGIFPFYVPGAASFLGAFPLSHDRILIPRSDTPLDLQIEPEVGVLCRVSYDAGSGPQALHPVGLGAFNDCSIRREGARKISEKKNWGADSKGVAGTFLDVDDLGPEGPTSTFRLASFLRRDGQAHAYGVDSPLPGYSYYGGQLLDWLIDRLRFQTGSDDTPLEPVGAYLTDAGNPETVLIGIGATRYTPYGASTYLEPGDTSIVIVYDGSHTDPDAVLAAVAAGDEDALPVASVLRQTVQHSG